MSTILEEHYKTQYIELAIEYEREVYFLSEAMLVLKTALEKISNQSMGESSRIACEALDTVYPIKGATK